MGVWKDSVWKVRPREDLAQPGEGDVQILDIVCRGHRQVWVVNVYDAPRASDRVRPARPVEWSHVITQGTILAGDFNAHSRRWNPYYDVPLHHKFLEDLMDVHDLRYVGDGQETHSQSGQLHLSVINLVFATMELAPHVQAVRLDDPAHVTTSDHEALWWGVTTVVAPEEYDAPTWGWVVGEWLEDEDRAQKAALDWHHRSECRPLLSSHCSKDEVEEEAVWIRLQLTEMLDQSACHIRITAHSKRWWSPEVKSARQTYGRT
jgi:hypothetical protein